MGVRVKVGVRTDVMYVVYTLNFKLPCNEKRLHSEYILPAKSFVPQCEMADTRQCYDYGIHRLRTARMDF